MQIFFLVPYAVLTKWELILMTRGIRDRDA